MTNSLANKVIFITGASRGIGKAIALRVARDGGTVIIAAKTTEPHPKLEGTIYTVAEEVERAGGKALALAVDVRDEEQINAAVEKTIATFGRLDALINNASAISLDSTLNLPMKRYDLMTQINTRGTYLCSKICLPYLIKAENPHILTMSPPLAMQAKWFKNNLAYTLSKFGMSMCTLGLAEEFREHGVAVNSLWPKTIIATAAIANNFPPAFLERTRKPTIVADAAYAILTSNSREMTGNFFVDEDLLRAQGVTDFTDYAVKPGAKLIADFYLD